MIIPDRNRLREPDNNMENTSGLFVYTNLSKI